MIMRTRAPTPAEVTLSVPAGQVEAIRTSALELYQVCADALNHDAVRHLRSGEPLETLHARRAELAALERILDDVGWPGERVGEGSVTLTGPRRRLREVVWVALSRAATDLDAACRAYWHGGSDVTGLTRQVDDVHARLAMLAAVEGAE
jgi:hypothetical protein